VFVVSRIDSSTMFSSLGHDHAIGATRFTGDVTWGEGLACAIDVVVPVKDLKVDPPGFRKMAGIDLSVDMSADQKADIESNFKGKKQLEADKYPDIRFKGKSCSGTSGNVDVTGDFTMHGVTKTITVPMKVSVDPTTFKAFGRFSIKGSEYDMPPFVAPFGALKNLDKLDFTLDFVGAPG
jgi:polyisoprenoid-binding protein YceI